VSLKAVSKKIESIIVEKDFEFTATQGISGVQVYFDNTYWTPNIGSWDGSKWLPGARAPGQITLQVLGDWAEDLRPKNIIVTYSGGSGAPWLSVEGTSAVICSVDPYTSGANAALDFSLSYNICRLFFYENGGGGTTDNITNIQFDFG